MKSSTIGNLTIVSTLRLPANDQMGGGSWGGGSWSGGMRRVSFLRCVRNGSAWLNTVWLYIIIYNMCVCVGAMTTERTRPPVLHGGCHRHTNTHIHYAYFTLYTAQCVCVCEREYGHVRVLDDIIIIMWPTLLFYFFISAQPEYVSI